MRKRRFSNRSPASFIRSRRLRRAASATVAIIGNGGFGILHALLLQTPGSHVDALRAQRRALGAGARTRSVEPSTPRAMPIRDAMLRAHRTDAAPTRVVECYRNGRNVGARAVVRAARRTGLVLCRLARRYARLVSRRRGCTTTKSACSRRFISRRATCARRSISSRRTRSPLARLISHSYPLDRYRGCVRRSRFAASG